MRLVRATAYTTVGILIGAGLAYVHAQSVSTTQTPVDTSRFATTDTVTALQTIAQAASDLASSAKTSATAAQTAAGNAASTATQAQATAQSAATAASSAQGTAQSASQAAGSAATAASAAQSAATSATSAASAANATATAAQTAASNAASAAAAATSTAASVQTDYMGAYTLATLPSAAASNGKRILVTDLGGGPGYLRATNGCWKRVATTTASIQTVAVGTSVAVDGLATSPIVGLSGSAFASKATITVTNACSMPQLTVVIPAGVFTVTGALGININTSALSVAGIGTTGTWNDFAVAADGSSLTKIRGGSL